MMERRQLGRLAMAATLALGLWGSAHAAGEQRVKFSTNLGDFVVEVYPDYDGLIFHRVIADFMVQGGGFDQNYQQKATRAPIKHEGREALAKGLHNTVGTVAMARTNDPHSASSQFFINVVDNSRLDPVPIPDGDPVKNFQFQGKTYESLPRAQLVNHPMLFGYTVFGKVVSGMDVVEKIRNTPTGAAGPFPSDVPKTPVIIHSATLQK